MFFHKIFQKPLQYSVKCSCKACVRLNRSGVPRAGFPSTHTKLGRSTNITWFWHGRVFQFAACEGQPTLWTPDMSSLSLAQRQFWQQRVALEEKYEPRRETTTWSRGTVRAKDVGVWCVYQGNYRGKYRSQSQGLAQHWLFVVQTNRKNDCTWYSLSMPDSNC